MSVHAMPAGKLGLIAMVGTTTIIGGSVFLEAMSIAMIAALPGLFAAWVAYLAYRKGVHNQAAIHEVHLTLNSRLDQLVLAAAGLARAEGIAQGLAQGVAGQGKVEG